MKRCEPLQSTSNPGGVIKHTDNRAPGSCCLKYLTGRNAGRKMGGFIFWHKHSVWIRVSKLNTVSHSKVSIFCGHFTITVIPPISSPSDRLRDQI